MPPIPVVYLGMACDASLPPLAALLTHGFDLRALVLADSAGALRPSPPAITPQSAIVTLAERHAVPVMPIRRLDRAAVAAIAAYRPEAIVVACFPWRLPPVLLNLPSLGCLNVHPSLLPIGRGPEPVFWTLRRGERQTGVTIHLMDAGFDTGPVLARRAIATPVGERAGAIESRLMALGGDLLVETLPKLAAGTIVPVPQDDALATRAPSPTAADFVVPTNLPATWAYAFVRGVAEYGIPLTVLVDRSPRPISVLDALEHTPDAQPGEALVNEELGVIRVRFRPGTVRFRQR